ncbi:hypothetical protein [Streptomyces sp. cmx-4-9]|uniref:hypothetical protein n=1 Tax=Streptomyces sp. cmx-4-9 TaxID=2790941 RepID=UPI00397F7A86
MSGTRGGRRTRAPWAVLTQALTVACVVLLCVFGAGPAGAAAAESRPGASAPVEPTEGPSDPAGDPEARAAVRPLARAVPVVRRLPLPVFHVKQPSAGAPCGAAGPSAGTAEPALSVRAVRSVVLRC